jgi:MFS family permease
MTAAVTVAEGADGQRARGDGGPLGLSRTYWLLWLGTLVNRLGGGVLPFLSVYLTTVRHLSLATAGVVVGLYAAGGAIAAPLGGLLADRVGRKRTIVAGSALAGSTMLGLGAARLPWQLGALAALLGLFTDMCRPALQAAVADVVPPAERRRAYGLLYWALNLGFSGAAILAGTLAAWSFGAVFVIDAATTLFYGAVVLLAVPETRPARDPSAAPSFLHELSLPFRDRAFAVFAMIQLPVLAVFVQMFVAFALDMRGHGLSIGTVGYVLSANGIVIVLLQPLVLRLTTRAAHHHLLAAGAALTGLGYGVCALAGGTPVFAAAGVIFTLGEIGFSIATPAFIANLAPAAHRGGYLGANQLIWGVAATTAPALGSFVLARAGGPALWIGCAAVGLTAATLHLTITGRFSSARTTTAG